MSPRPKQRQQVMDQGHHCNYSQVPHLLLQHVAEGGLPPSAVVLYLHYVQLSWAQHGRPIQETLRDASQETGLSNGTILTARESLAKKGWIGVETQGQRRHQFVTITLLDRWQENCPGHDSVYGQNLSNADSYAQKLTSYGQKPAIAGRKLSIDDLKTALKTEDVKDLTQQHAREDEDDPDRAIPLPRLLTRVPDDPEDEFVSAFYRGLGEDARTLTRPLLRREWAVARDLIAAGSTPSEAEAFARDVAADDRRRAPVDGLRTFERERLSWRSRRGHAQQREGPRFVDRSGQVPEWELPIAAGGGSA